MKIKVTQSHINRGVRMDGALCPISLAVTEQTGRSCCISFRHCEFMDSDGMYGMFKLPIDAIDFYHNFDHGCPVKPFEFELPIEGLNNED